MTTPNMSRLCTALFCFLGLFVPAARSAPILTVAPLGLNASNNRDWAVDITPDPNLLPSSLAVELAFAVDQSELLDVDVNTAVWDTETIGFNPFTNDLTEGLWLDLIGDRTFGAFGSIVLASADPVRLFTIETQGSGLTTIRYGMAASGSNLGSIIAQGEEQFEDYTGSVTVPEPATFALAIVVLCAGSSPRARRHRLLIVT